MSEPLHVPTSIFRVCEHKPSLLADVISTCPITFCAIVYLYAAGLDITPLQDIHLFQASSGALLVAAIDFGTTYSGWACSFQHEFKLEPTKIKVKHWYTGSGSLMTEKTPTCALIKPDGKTLEAFGYEAENKYNELVENDEHNQYYFFKRFKMALHNKVCYNQISKCNQVSMNL